MSVKQQTTALVAVRSARKSRNAGGGKARDRSRRMALLRRAGLFGVDTRGAIIRRAMSIDDLAAAYRLVHFIYLKQGYIRPQPGGLRVRVFEAAPEMATFVAEADASIVAVLGLAVDSVEIGLPADQAFHAELNSLRTEDRLVCEVTNQVVVPAYRSCAVATELMRCMFAHALLLGCDELTMTVSPCHVRFYELLGFEAVSPVRSHSDEVYDPTILMRVNVSRLIRWVENADDRSDGAALFIKLRCLHGTNEYCCHVGRWHNEARATFTNPAALHHLFVERTGLLDRLSDDERSAIRDRWGPEVFDAVMGGVPVAALA